MNARRLTTMTVLATAAGLALSAQAQYQNDRTPQRQAQPGNQRPTDRDMRQNHSEQLRVLDMHKADDVLGSDVLNERGENIGSIEDVIVDRGNGRIDYLIVQSGDILGIGGRKVAVPYEAFGFNAQKGQFSLDATEKALSEGGLSRRSDWVVFGDGPDASAKDVNSWLATYHRGDGLQERWGNKLKDSKTRTISGEITGIRHDSNMGGGDCVVVDVRTDEDQNVALALGPSWYVMGSEASPDRGDHIVAKIVDRTPEWDKVDRDQVERRDNDWNDRDNGDRIDRDRNDNDRNNRDRQVDRDRDMRNAPPAQRGQPDMRWQASNADAVVLEARIDDRQLKLWDKDAQNAWTYRPGADRDHEDRYQQFVRLTEVIGADLRASTIGIGTRTTGDNEDSHGIEHRGDRVDLNVDNYADAGDVQGALIERMSGTIPALVIDPDVNFLGIGDTARLVPWSVLRIHGEKDVIRLDADKDMLTACEPLPDDVSDLDTWAALSEIYRPFQMEPRPLRERQMESASAMTRPDRP